jgi:hypothetical protein
VRGNRPGGRYADTKPELITIYWRDIPAQVTARAGRHKAAVQLRDEFQVAIDRAAVVARKHTTDEYLAEWRRVAVPCGDDLEEAVDAAAANIDRAYPPERLKSLIANGGLEPQGR